MKRPQGIASIVLAWAWLLAGWGSGSPGLAQEEPRPMRVEIRGDWFYVDGEKFFIKGVCFFENHEVEGRFERSSLDILDHEFRKIKEAGFNTVRSQLNAKELALAKKHGLMVLQGANHLFFSKEYQDPAQIRENEETTRRITSYSKKHDNILYYLIDNEPEIQEGIYRQGTEAFRNFHTRLISSVQKIQPGAKVSMASYPPAAFLDYSLYDCVSLNLYPFCPSCDSVGYGGYAQWFKKKHASGKPLIISEYGWETARGEQAFPEAMLELLDEQIKAGATGAFFYTWRAFGEEGQGDNRWYGIVPNAATPQDYQNSPRRLYGDFQNYFQAVIIQPAHKAVYGAKVPVEIYGTDRTHSMEATLDKQTFPLRKDGKYWWKGELSLRPDEDGEKEIKVIAKDAGGNILAEKKQIFYAGRKDAGRWIKIVRITENHEEGGTYRAKLLVENAESAPVPLQRLRISINETGTSLWTSQNLTAETNGAGIYEFTRKGLAPGYFTIAAQTEPSIPGQIIEPEIDIVPVAKKDARGSVQS